MVNLYRVANSLLAGRISEKVAGLTLWSIAIGMPGARKLSPQRSRRAQRKSKILPRISADERGSERKVGSELTRTQGCASRDLGGSTPRNTGASLTMTSRGAAKSARRSFSHSGVSKDKSFISGVAHGRTPGAKVRGSDFCENSLKRYGRIQHSRDLSTPPRVAHARSESLKRTRGGERGARLQRGVFRNESAESGDGRIGTSAHRDTGVSGKPLNMSVDGKSGVVDNSGQTEAAPYKPRGVKTDDRPRKVPVCGAVNSNGRRTR